MEKLNEAQQGVLKALASAFYDVVPTKLRTFCTLTSDISARVLQHFGLNAVVIPCQLWHVRHGSNIVVGFTNREPPPGKWNGHAICIVDDWFIDAALQQLNLEFGLTVPRLAIGRRFTAPSLPIARVDLSPTEQLWWHLPPVRDPVIPVVSPDLALRYSQQLIERIAQAQPA